VKASRRAAARSFYEAARPVSQIRRSQSRTRPKDDSATKPVATSGGATYVHFSPFALPGRAMQSARRGSRSDVRSDRISGHRPLSRFKNTAVGEASQPPRRQSKACSSTEFGSVHPVPRPPQRLVLVSRAPAEAQPLSALQPVPTRDRRRGAVPPAIAKDGDSRRRC